MSFSVVIPSANDANLMVCLNAIAENEPLLTPEQVIVVKDDGEEPFVFARNVNYGIHEAGDRDVILLNDDAILMTPNGFTDWADVMRHLPHTGVCSAGIDGVVCNNEQKAQVGGGYRRAMKHLAFVCVYIPRATINTVGLLDERFTGYGFDDYDYCRRVSEAGLQLGVWHNCRLDHSGTLPSTFRTRPDIRQLFEQGQRIYWDKWEASSDGRRH